MSSTLEGWYTYPDTREACKGREAEVVGKAGEGTSRTMGGCVCHKKQCHFLCSVHKERGDPELGRKNFGIAFPTIRGY